jgi:hypothetical protein
MYWEGYSINFIIYHDVTLYTETFSFKNISEFRNTAPWIYKQDHIPILTIKINLVIIYIRINIFT